MQGFFKRNARILTLSGLIVVLSCLTVSNLVHIAKMEAHLVKLEDRLMLADENIKDTINTKVKQVQCNCNRGLIKSMFFLHIFYLHVDFFRFLKKQKSCFTFFVPYKPTGLHFPMHPSKKKEPKKALKKEPILLSLLTDYRKKPPAGHRLRLLFFNQLLPV